jgi:hypothetical protein
LKSSLKGIVVELSEISAGFASRIAEMEYASRVTQEVMDEEMNSLSEQIHDKENEAEPPVDDDFRSLWFSAVLYRQLRSGQLVGLTSRRQGAEDRRISIMAHKNRQYQWLLAAAYEEFENLVRMLYAYCGKNDPTFWPMEDYGNIVMSEVDSKDFAWYKDRAKNRKKNSAREILNTFRLRWPELAALELDNGIKINMKFVLVLIEKLRHIIVHNGGVTADIAQFKEGVLRDAGLPLKFAERSAYENYVGNYLGQGQYEA